jgi:hypothetical protein
LPDFIRACHGLRLFGVEILCRLFDQRDDVAHAENAVGDAAGMEFLERIHLFAGADQLDRLAGDSPHRQRGTAAAIAVHAGQHQAGNAATRSSKLRARLTAS